MKHYGNGRNSAPAANSADVIICIAIKTQCTLLYIHNKNIYTHICMQTHKYTHMFTHTGMHTTHMNRHTHIHKQIHLHTHTHDLHTCIHIHSTRTHIQAWRMQVHVHTPACLAIYTRTCTHVTHYTH